MTEFPKMYYSVECTANEGHHLILGKLWPHSLLSLLLPIPHTVIKFN